MQTLLCRKVPAEDGVNLATDVYLPDGPGPFPTVIVRTPYHRVGLQGTAHQFTASRGYAFVAYRIAVVSTIPMVFSSHWLMRLATDRRR